MEAAAGGPIFKVARQVLRIGVPAALEQMLVSTAFLALAMVVAHLGTEVLAAHRVAFNALSLSFLPGIGFGIAATALVGQSIGARRIAEGAAAARVATTWAVIWMSAIAVLLFIFAPQVLRLVHRRPGGDRGGRRRPARGGAGAAVLGGAVRPVGRAAWHRQHLVPAEGDRQRHLALGRAGMRC